MIDLALEKYIEGINKKYNDMLSEQEVCDILGFNRNYFYKLRCEQHLIPFLKIGNRISYLKDDVLQYLKNARRVKC